VEVKVDGKYVYLKVGQKDWQWEKESGRLIAEGLLHVDGTRKGMRADMGIVGMAHPAFPDLGLPDDPRKSFGTQY
jgi:hypothetical protein